MIELLLLWVVLFCILVFYIRPREGGGLTLAYFLSLSLIHVPGVLAFMDPASGFGGREYTRAGFEMTLIGLVAFLAGVILAHRANRRSGDAQVHAPRTPASVFERAGWRALAIGVVAYFVLIPVSGFVPSLTAVVSALATLLILGLWLRLYGAAAARDKKGTLAILALLPLLPTRHTGDWWIHWLWHRLDFERRGISFCHRATTVLVLPRCSAGDIFGPFSLRHLYGSARGNQGRRLARACWPVRAD